MKRNFITLSASSLLFFLLVFKLSAVEPALQIQLTEQNSRGEERYNCNSSFLGVLQPTPSEKKFLNLKINLNMNVPGIKFNVMYTNNGYNRPGLEKYVTYTTKSKNLTIPIYPVDDNYPFAVNQVFVTAMTSDQNVSDSFTFRIYRPVILQKSADDSQDCYQMFKAEKITGILTNNSSQPRSLDIEDRLDKSRSSNIGVSRGWAVGLSALNVINGTYGHNYMKNQSHGLSQSSSVSISTNINPGESLVMTKQLTLMKDFYTVSSVDECGELKEVGEATYQHWVVTYPVAKVDLTSTDPLRKINIGYNDTINTCVENIGSYSSSEQIFIPDSKDEKSNYIAEIKDTTSFNDLGKTLADEESTVSERKSKFKSFFSKIFRRR